VRVETAKVASRGGNGKGQGTKGTRIWMARRDVDAAAIARWGGLGVRGVRRCPEGRLGGGRIFRPARPGVPIPRAGIIDGTEAAAQEQASTMIFLACRGTGPCLAASRHHSTYLSSGVSPPS
jgi:hypothetical protein